MWRCFLVRDCKSNCHLFAIPYFNALVCLHHELMSDYNKSVKLSNEQVRILETRNWKSNYYHRFLPRSFHQITAQANTDYGHNKKKPLSFASYWNCKCQLAFNALKAALMTTSVLGHRFLATI